MTKEMCSKCFPDFLPSVKGFLWCRYKGVEQAWVLWQRGPSAQGEMGAGPSWGGMAGQSVLRLRSAFELQLTKKGLGIRTG